ncbi:MAG: porin [Gammaproteobacteria bacterium]|nr:porin [Gammaproteobacteria bacterium]
MKRKKIAIALTGMLALPLWMSTAAAEFSIDGKVHASIDFMSNDDEDSANDDSTLALSSNASRIRFKGDEQINDDLSAHFQAEFEFFADTGGWDTDDRNDRNTFVGLTGGFGTIDLGRIDTPYKQAYEDMFGDTRADVEAIIGSIDGAVDFEERVANQIQYTSPDLNGAKVKVGYSLGVDATEDDLPKAAEPDNTMLSAAVLYGQGPLSLSAAIEQYKTGTGGDEDPEAMKMSGGWDFGQGTKVSVIYEDIDNGDDDARSAFYISGSHKLSDTMKLMAAVGQADDLDSTDESGASHFALGLSNKLAKNTEVYALYASVSNDDNARYRLKGVGRPDDPTTGYTQSAFSLGIVHKFGGKLM